MTYICAGGAANIRKLTEDERKNAQEHNQKLRSASVSKDKGFIKGLKDLVKGDKSDKDEEVVKE